MTFSELFGIWIAGLGVGVVVGTQKVKDHFKHYEPEISRCQRELDDLRCTVMS